MKPPSSFLFFFFFIFTASSFSSSSSSSSSSPHRRAKGEEFLRRLLEKSSKEKPTILPPSSPSLSNTKGRIFSPLDYGADPTGKQDSSDAILAAVAAAFSIHDGESLLAGVNDVGGAVVDLQGGNYKVDKPITFPPTACGNLIVGAVRSGSLRASNKFPGDRHLVELWNPLSKKIKGGEAVSGTSSRIFYEHITFRDILFDSGLRGGGLFVIDSARIRVVDCLFLNFTTQGILVEMGHEVLITGCYMGQKPTTGADPGEKHFSGIAIELASNDNMVTDVVIFSAAIGLLLRGQANMITDVHCYNKASTFGGIGMLLRLPGLSQTRIDNCYLDYNGIVMEDPVQVHVTNCFFLGGGKVVMRAVKGRVSGVKVVENMFNGVEGRRGEGVVEVKGRFWEVEQVVVERNSVKGMVEKSTVGRKVVRGNGTRWEADFSGVLVFGEMITHFQYSVGVRGGGIGGKMVSHGVTKVGGNRVLVESDKGMDAVVSVFVDQSGFSGDRILLP